MIFLIILIILQLKKLKSYNKNYQFSRGYAYQQILSNIKVQSHFKRRFGILIKAKKKFGQNFLKDESIKKKIIQSMSNDNRQIVEIGPGLGDLTRELLTANKQVTAFEIDFELCGYLQKKFKTFKKNRISKSCYL